MRDDLDPYDAGVTAETVREFAGSPSSIAAARALATGFLVGLRDRRGRRLAPQVVIDVQLVVSELVTNAVKFAPGPCTVSLRVRGRHLEVSVADSAPEPPVP